MILSSLEPIHFDLGLKQLLLINGNIHILLHSDVFNKLIGSKTNNNRKLCFELNDYIWVLFYHNSFHMIHVVVLSDHHDNMFVKGYLELADLARSVQTSRT